MTDQLKWEIRDKEICKAIFKETRHQKYWDKYKIYQMWYKLHLRYHYSIKPNYLCIKFMGQFSNMIESKKNYKFFKYIFSFFSLFNLNNSNTLSVVKRSWLNDSLQHRVQGQILLPSLMSFLTILNVKLKLFIWNLTNILLIL